MRSIASGAVAWGRQRSIVSHRLSFGSHGRWRRGAMLPKRWLWLLFLLRLHSGRRSLPPSSRSGHVRRRVWTRGMSRSQRRRRRRRRRREVGCHGGVVRLLPRRSRRDACAWGRIRGGGNERQSGSPSRSHPPCFRPRVPVEKWSVCLPPCVPLLLLHRLLWKGVGGRTRRAVLSWCRSRSGGRRSRCFLVGRRMTVGVPHGGGGGEGAAEGGRRW